MQNNLNFLNLKSYLNLNEADMRLLWQSILGFFQDVNIKNKVVLEKQLHIASDSNCVDNLDSYTRYGDRIIKLGLNIYSSKTYTADVILEIIPENEEADFTIDFEAIRNM